MVALGRSLAVLAGAVVVGEVLMARPGVGGLLLNALINEDRYVIADCCTVFLITALVGQVVAALAGVWLDRVDPVDAPTQAPIAQPAPPFQAQATPPFAAQGMAPPPGMQPALGPRPGSVGAGRSGLGAVLGIVALVSLVVPVLVFLASLVAGNPNHFDMAHVAQGASSAHPFGTDQVGRDVLAQVLVGYRHALLSAVGAVLLAGVVGVGWGGLAALVARRLPGAGGPLAEVVLAPARLIAVAPLLIAAIMLVAGDGWAATLALAVALVARIAAAVAELDQPATAPLRELGRAAGGVALAAVGAGLAVLVGLGFLGFGTHPPTPSLGGVLGNSMQYVYQSNAGLLAALVVLLVTVPWLLAGVALARNPRRVEAVGTLEA